jgi:hypothetical protein
MAHWRHVAPEKIKTLIQGSNTQAINVEYMLSGFRHVLDICAVLGYYATYSGNSLPTFWDILSVPSSRVRKSKTIGLLDP